MKVRQVAGSSALFVADRVLAFAAGVYKRQASVLDVAGAGCVAVFAASFGGRWAWLACGVYLLVRAGQLEAKS